jgi:DNA polymerase-3 subunit delta
LAELSRYVKRPNPQAILLMEGSSLSGTTALAKAVEKEGLLLKIPELRPWEAERSVEDWMQAYVARSQHKLEPAASKVLAKQLGTDKTLLASEIDKLLSYVGERKGITVDDVTAVCCCVPLDTVWQLGEAVLGRQVHQALKITRQQLLGGVQFLGLLWQLRAQLNTAYQVAAILALGGGPQGVSAQFPYMRGKILERNMRLAQAYGLKRFKRAIQLVNQSDSHAKNSQGAAELLAETLIIKLCQA